MTCDLPTSPVPYSLGWTHLNNIHLADPDFGTPGRIDLLLGVDIFTEVLLRGRRKGPPRSPIALETSFGWVLCGNTDSPIAHSPAVVTCHALVELGDDLLRKFWEIEETPDLYPHLSIEESTVVQHFKMKHIRKPDGSFIVPLPKSSDSKTLGIKISGCPTISIT